MNLHGEENIIRKVSKKDIESKVYLRDDPNYVQKCIMTIVTVKRMISRMRKG